MTGFVEGEGSFTYSRVRQGVLNLYFSVKLPAADAGLLEALQAYFGGVGRIYDVKAREPRGRGRASKAAKLFRITRLDELLVVVQHFEVTPFQGEKRESFALWREMVQRKLAGFRRGPDLELDNLAGRLSAASPRNRRA